MRHLLNAMAAMLITSVVNMKGSISKYNNSPIISPPGMRLRGWLGFVYHRKTMEAVFDQILNDALDDWREHECAGRHRHAQMAKLRCYFSILQAVFAHGGSSILTYAVRFWKIKH